MSVLQHFTINFMFVLQQTLNANVKFNSFDLKFLKLKLCSYKISIFTVVFYSHFILYLALKVNKMKENVSR